MTSACPPPAAPRCGSPMFPLFSPGISTRMVPQCSQSFCDCEVAAVGRYRVTSAGTLDRSHWIEGWIINQLSTRGEVSCEEHTLKKRDGGWWADAYRTPTGNFKSGSKLWSLQWAHVSNDALMLAKQFATEALQYLIAAGIASKLNIETSYINKRVMRLQITVTGPGITANATVQGQAMPNASWLWQEYKGT